MLCLLCSLFCKSIRAPGLCHRIAGTYIIIIIILFTPAQLRASGGASPFAFWREDLNLLMYPV
jgi:hypothetical protein